MERKKHIPVNELREFVVNNVGKHPHDLTARITQHFGITRQSAANRLRKFVDEGVLEAEGRTKARRYALRNFVDESVTQDVSDRLAEDTEWRNNILPYLNGVPKNVLDICQYGFCEMVNNVIDHSEAKKFIIAVTRNVLVINLVVWDFGVGIFNKIQRDFDLDDPRHALLELSKGKLTSDPDKHTGEGVFFTSRMFDEFSIVSDTLVYLARKSYDEWLIDFENRVKKRTGTVVTMAIANDAQQTIQEIFKKYSDDEWRFMRTHVPLRLAKYEGEQLVSRSQAKRLLARVDRFSEVMLDFDGVSTIGQAFADEIFRVYSKSHQDVEIVAINTAPEVQQMIDRVINE